jgi:galactonate dehydratase
VRRYVIGQDPRHPERIWERMYRESAWARGGGVVLMAAMSAIDEALWDITGKALNQPVYMLLGGKLRDRIRLYANGWYRTGGPPSEYAEDAEKVVKDGFLALKFDPFQDVSKELAWRPRRIWYREEITAALARVAAVRKAIGPEVEILLEGHGWFDVNTAIEIARRVEEYDIKFFEEPLDTTNVEALARLAQTISIPIATGEKLYTRWGFLPFLQQGAMTICQPDVGNTGGISETRKIATLAETFLISVAPHNCWGPIGTAATIHVDVAIPNFIVQELFPYEGDNHYRMVDQAYESNRQGGYIVIDEDRPGLGVNLDEKFMAPNLVETITA